MVAAGLAVDAIGDAIVLDMVDLDLLVEIRHAVGCDD